MSILGWATTRRADGWARPSIVRRPNPNRNSHGSEAQRLTDSLPYWELESVPGWRPNSVEYIRTSTYGILSSYRQNVVLVGAGRISRSARFVTSSKLLYLLNPLYNTPIECCDEYKLIQLYQKSSVWCFASSHTSTFELIPSVTNGSTRSHGNNWWRILYYARILHQLLPEYRPSTGIFNFPPHLLSAATLPWKTVET